MRYHLSLDGCLAGSAQLPGGSKWPPDTIFIGAVSSPVDEELQWDIYYSKDLNRYGWVSRYNYNYFSPLDIEAPGKSWSLPARNLVEAFINRSINKKEAQPKTGSRFSRLQT